MTPVAAGQTSISNAGMMEGYGLMKRDDRDINQAVFVPGNFEFEGPAVSLQKFEDGGVIVEQGGKMRGVQPDIFMRTYRLSDGSPISSLSTDIKTLSNTAE